MASQLRAAGLTEACEVMESAATFVTSSGWEWLGELGAAATENASAVGCAQDQERLHGRGKRLLLFDPAHPLDRVG